MNDEEAENMNVKGSFSFWSLLLTLYFQDMLPLTDLKKNDVFGNKHALFAQVSDAFIRVKVKSWRFVSVCCCNLHKQPWQWHRIKKTH